MFHNLLNRLKIGAILAGGLGLVAVSPFYHFLQLGVVFLVSVHEITCGVSKKPTWLRTGMLVLLCLGVGALAITGRMVRSEHPLLVLYPYGVAWLADVAAYFVGSAIGKTPLAPVISPGKTLEGFVAGVLSAPLTSQLVKVLTGGSLFIPSVWFSLFLGLVGMMGDLAFSWVKRRSGIKDFGKTCQSHGGILDRYDSVIFVAISYFFYLMNARAS